MLYNLDEEEARKLGKIIQAEREKQGMTQGELAELLGVSRVTVYYMESQGKGLHNIYTRRAVAKALGISPAVLGVLSEDAKPEVFYDTKILQTTFQLHVENYFTTGTVTLSDVEEMIKSILTILKSKDHKDKNVLKVLHGYTWLAIDLSRQALDRFELDRYIGWSVQLGKELGDPVSLARTYVTSSTAMLALGRYEDADDYAQEALNLKNTPSYVHGAALETAGLAKNDPDLIDSALTIVKNNPHAEDVAYLHVSPDICMIDKVRVLIGSNNLVEAESVLADAQEYTPAHMLRRQVLLQWLEAELAMKKGTYDQAAFVTLSAVPLAKQINSQQNIERLRTVYAGLLESDHARSQTVRLIGQAL